MASNSTPNASGPGTQATTSDFEVILRPKKVVLGFKTFTDGTGEVSYTIECASGYEARVLHEDLLERLNSGAAITFAGKFDDVVEAKK